jgi:hypothetical protein
MRMLKGIERKDVLNVGGAFLAVYGVVAFFCFLYIMERWANAAPTAPDPTHGLIYAHNEHGWITYFSAFQTTSCTLLFSTSIPLSFVGAFVSPKQNIGYHRRGCLAFGAKWDPDDPKRLRRIGFLCGAVAAPIIVFILGPLLVDALNSNGIVLPFG